MLRYVGVLLALAGATAVAAGLVRGGWVVLAAWWQSPTAARTPAGLVAPVCAIGAGLLLGWIGLSGLVSAATRIPGRVGRHAHVVSVRVAPSVVRAGVAAALGGSLALGTASLGASPAPTAASAVHSTVAATAASDPASPSPSHPPDRPPSPPGDVGLVSSAPAPARPSVDAHVVVQRGDSLWAIAARHLGPHAGAGEIAHAWQRWYAANRDVIGDDPDLIRPGQLLVPPPDPGRAAP